MQDDVPRFCAYSAPAKFALLKPSGSNSELPRDPRFAGQWYASDSDTSSPPLLSVGERKMTGSAPPILECHVPMPDPATCSHSTLMETLKPPATSPPAALQVVISHVSVCWRWFDGQDWDTRKICLDFVSSYVFSYVVFDILSSYQVHPGPHRLPPAPRYRAPRPPSPWTSPLMLKPIKLLESPIAPWNCT